MRSKVENEQMTKERKALTLEGLTLVEKAMPDLHQPNISK